MRHLSRGTIRRWSAHRDGALRGSERHSTEGTWPLGAMIDVPTSCIAHVGGGSMFFAMIKTECESNNIRHN